MEKEMQYDARNLATSIFDFLLEEMYDNTRVPKWSKEYMYLYRATDCLDKVYRIQYMDCLLKNKIVQLREVFSLGSRPIKVKDRLKAEEHKKNGNAFMADNKAYKSAETEYSKAIVLNPRNAVYWCNRAASRIGLEYYIFAIFDCEEALKMDRSYTKALVWMGIAHALTDSPEKAIRCYRRALRIEPGNEICITNMDAINRKLNRSAFRILEPLSSFGRHLALMAANSIHNQVPFKRLKPCSGNQGRRGEKYLRFEELD